jgi:hypothetical protein
MSELAFYSTSQTRITTVNEKNNIDSGVDGDRGTPGAYALEEGSHPVAEHPYQGMDSDTATKWLDMNAGDLVVNFGAPVTVATYDWATANDEPARDPVKWALHGSNDGTTWRKLQSAYAEIQFEPTIERLAYQGPFGVCDGLRRVSGEEIVAVLKDELCMATCASGTGYPWVQVDLLDPHYVHLVRVIGSTDELKNVSVSVSHTEAFRAGSDCVRSGSALDKVQTFTCAVVGRFSRHVRLVRW